MNLSLEARNRAYNFGREDDEILRIYWFPSDSEIRFVLIIGDYPYINEEDTLVPFYFAPSSTDNLDLYDAIIGASVEDERNKKKLPDDWGSWKDGILLFEQGRSVNNST